MWDYIQLAVLNKVHLNTCLQNIFSTLQTTLAVQQKHFSFVCMSVLTVKNVPILTLIQAKLDNVREASETSVGITGSSIKHQMYHNWQVHFWDRYIKTVIYYVPWTLWL